MFDSIEQAMARQQSMPRYSTPVVTTVDDIRRVLTCLDPNNRNKSDQIDLQTEMVGSNQDSGMARFSVSAKMTSYNQRDMLLKALGDIKKKQDRIMELSQKDVEPLMVGGKTTSACKMVDTRLPIDDIISRAFGGRRDGALICWDLSDGYTYRYDVFDHKLTRIKSNETNAC